MKPNAAFPVTRSSPGTRLIVVVDAVQFGIRGRIVGRPPVWCRCIPIELILHAQCAVIDLPSCRAAKPADASQVLRQAHTHVMSATMPLNAVRHLRRPPAHGLILSAPRLGQLFPRSSLDDSLTGAFCATKAKEDATGSVQRNVCV